MAEETFADWLIRQQKARRISNRDLAQYVGVTRFAVVTWANGRSHPMPETCVKLAQLFGVPPEDVLRMAGW